ERGRPGRPGGDGGRARRWFLRGEWVGTKRSVGSLVHDLRPWPNLRAGAARRADLCYLRASCPALLLPDAPPSAGRTDPASPSHHGSPWLMLPPRTCPASAARGNRLEPPAAGFRSSPANFHLRRRSYVCSSPVCGDKGPPVP